MIAIIKTNSFLTKTTTLMYNSAYERVLYMGKKAGSTGFRSSSMSRSRSHSTRMSTRVSGRGSSGSGIRLRMGSHPIRNFTTQSQSSTIWDKLRSNPLPSTRQSQHSVQNRLLRHRPYHSRGYSLSERVRMQIEDFFYSSQTTEQPHSIYDQWDYQQKTRTMKVFAMMFAYVLKQDDGKVSFLERRTFRKMIQLERSRITEYDYRELMNLIRLSPTKNDVLQFFMKHQVPVETVRRTADRIDRIMKYEIKYTGETNELLQRYDVMKEY